MTDRIHYPRPTKWSRCASCGSTWWSLEQDPEAAADAALVHAAFCKSGGSAA